MRMHKRELDYTSNLDKLYVDEHWNTYYDLENELVVHVGFLWGVGLLMKG